MHLPAALPPLEGRFGAALRGAFLGLAGLTLLMLAWGGWLAATDFFVTVPNNLAFGFVTGSGSPTAPDTRQVRVFAASSDAARRSGLKRDDIILSVDGHAVPAHASEHDIGRLTGAVKGDVATIVTRSTDGAMRVHRLPRQPDAWSEKVAGTGLTGWQRSALLFGADELRLLFLAAAALLLYRSRRRDPVALLFGTVLLLFCHVSGSGFWFWHRLGVDGYKPWLASFLYALLAVALSAFPDGRFPSRWTRWLVAGGVPLFVALALFQLLTGRLPLYLPSWLTIALLLACGLGLVLRFRGLPRGTERQQAKWAVAGAASYILLTAAVAVPRLLLFGAEPGPAMFVASVLAGAAASILLPLGLLVSLLRYRLYDAEAAISRSAAYSILTLGLLIGFAASKKGLELFAEHLFEGSAAALSGGVAAAIAALMITPLHHKVTRWAEERFHKALIAMRRLLPDEVGDLRETAGLAELGEAVLARIERGVRATRLALVVEGHAVATRNLGAGGPPVETGDPRFPVVLELRRPEGEPLGAILLGPRPDGSLYGKDERRALETIAGPVARDVDVVLRREAAARARAAEIGRLKTRIRALETRLAAPLGPGGSAAAAE
ncbi:MAG TPA: hypothetical protein VGD66_01645 [Allosphingosinicella sp.]